FVLKTKPKPENIIGVIIVILGLAVLTEAHITLPNIGDVITFACAIAFAIHVVLLNKYSDSNNFYLLAFGQFLTMTIASFVFMMIFEILIFENFFVELNSILIFTLIYGSLFATLISILVMTKYQRMTTPVRAGIIYSMEAVFAVGFSYLILHEILNTTQIAGIIVMLIGLCISEFYSYIKNKLTK
ncbi:MAG: DMT family transporter, partial [Ignavibacteria bacterium]